MPDLKLIALDQDDLAVLSAHIQDAILRAGDMAFQRSEQRFALVANRFDWERYQAGAGDHQRRRCGLRFERVKAAQVQGLKLTDKDQTLSLLAIAFEPMEAPEGYIVLTFAGHGAVRLHVECVEAELKDLGAAWTAGSAPSHGGDA